MSIVRPRSHSSDSPDSIGWQGVRGIVNIVGANGGDDDYGQFRRNERRDSFPSSSGSTPGICPPISPSSSHSKALNGLNSGSPSAFAMTPADFHLFPSTPRSTVKSRKPRNTEIERQDEFLGVNHLTTLRSAAFWELRRSVIENGEGLIRRMRDYEQSRLHKQIRQKANERKRWGRKSTLRSTCKPCPRVSEASDEDEVLICSEDISKSLSPWPPLSTRARSLEPMVVDGQDQDRLERRASRSMPGADQVQLEGMPFTGNSRIKEMTRADMETFLYIPDSASPTPSPSSVSLPPPHSSSMTPDTLLVPPTTPSEKALAELNVAFANGACSIADYSPIWTYQKQFNADEHDTAHGDLWR